MGRNSTNISYVALDNINITSFDLIKTNEEITTSTTTTSTTTISNSTTSCGKYSFYEIKCLFSNKLQ